MVAMALIVACSVTMAQDAKQLRKECIVYKVLNSSSHYFLPPLAHHRKRILLFFVYFCRKIPQNATCLME